MALFFFVPSVRNLRNVKTSTVPLDDLSNHTLADKSPPSLLPTSKMTKVLKPTFDSVYPFVHVFDPLRMSEGESITLEYDRIATSNISLILYPLVIGGGMFSLKFYRYTSWWSFLVSHAANAVYMLGFIKLCPQIYINYRLKSIAHLPWKVFIYKIFNTFVDDVFAVLIDMPMKHRIMTLRDDFIFILFLIQAYIYRVDYSRANEYGLAYDEGVEKNALINGEEGKKEIGTGEEEILVSNEKFEGDEQQDDTGEENTTSKKNN